MTHDQLSRVPVPENEPVRSYAPGSPERESLKATLEAMSAAEPLEIRGCIGGEPAVTGNVGECRQPHAHAKLLARFQKCGAHEVKRAVAAASAAHTAWGGLAWEQRAAVFLKAAELLAGPFRDRMNAATMLGQSKTVFQAEIDAACELIDFWRFNVHFMHQAYEEQPGSAPGEWNQLDHRPLEGFVFAVTPFNFTSIAGNLPTAPAMMGNTVIWKPATTSILSSYVIMEVLEAAGLPPGVINFLPGDGADVGDPALASPGLAGIHFTGSTGTFHNMWRRIGANIADYRSYPRIVGETGGKDFVFAHPSAELEPLVTALVRGAFEYQGQKCSAASRAFIPASLWERVLEALTAQTAQIRVGSPMDFRNFMCAVIDAKAYVSVMGYIEHARRSSDHAVILGGKGDDREGWFIEPTLVAADAPDTRLMREEIFGPVLTLYRYEDKRIDAALAALDRASPYALTGAVFCRDRAEIARLTRMLRFAAGNFYINDKPTGAVVGRQPFGGGRASGTNDKAGSVLNLLRWVSPRAIKETFAPPIDFRYRHMSEE
ncbi:MAG TPA: L-glutamate gamma-semialdehyde dehydrogenase [Gammaproteobacteria bacterium]|nr:L-glutamate gamma-semialdehyde dehydrogenase [Gammaproteobacteria bacterium]